MRGTVPEFGLFRRRLRNPAFSRSVLSAYGGRCAVCAFSARLHNGPVALEAAHIKWHMAGGPNRDEISNGLSLCALHQRLFDVSAFTLTSEYRVFTAKAAVGEGRGWSLGQYSDRPTQLPERKSDCPDPASPKWHHREVFGPIPKGGNGSDLHLPSWQVTVTPRVTEARRAPRSRGAPGGRDSCVPANGKGV